jgi:hypothetical protein
MSQYYDPLCSLSYNTCGWYLTGLNDMSVQQCLLNPLLSPLGGVRSSPIRTQATTGPIVPLPYDEHGKTNVTKIGRGYRNTSMPFSLTQISNYVTSNFGRRRVRPDPRMARPVIFIAGASAEYRSPASRLTFWAPVRSDGTEHFILHILASRYMSCTLHINIHFRKPM